VVRRTVPDRVLTPPDPITHERDILEFERGDGLYVIYRGRIIFCGKAGRDKPSVTACITALTEVGERLFSPLCIADPHQGFRNAGFPFDQSFVEQIDTGHDLFIRWVSAELVRFFQCGAYEWPEVPA
jgi:hypothetical protein